MSSRLLTLTNALEDALSDRIGSLVTAYREVTLTVSAENQISVLRELRDNKALDFSQLSDLCGVDYSLYGDSEWETDDCTSSGYSRGFDSASSGRLIFGDEMQAMDEDKQRFAVVYQLLSYEHNWRLRVKVFCENNGFPRLQSVVKIWSSADWIEREAFDLFGILFDEHPDLRRILTDYGFVGHPFRKDFPLSGHVEMRYDPEKRRVVYQPVTIEPRVLVPRVIRDDSRYLGGAAGIKSGDGKADA